MCGKGRQPFLMLKTEGARALVEGMNVRPFLDMAVRGHKEAQHQHNEGREGRNRTPQNSARQRLKETRALWDNKANTARVPPYASIGWVAVKELKLSYHNGYM